MIAKESNTLISGFEHKLARFSSGYVEGTFDGRKWGASVKRSTDGRRLWLFAEELGATDIVSFNLYRGTTRSFLKPCEMSSAKVVRFVLEFQPDT